MQQLAVDARSIWQAGVDAVRADRVMMDQIEWDGRHFVLGDDSYDLSRVRRVVVVGAGKATLGMWRGLQNVFRSHAGKNPELTGWINVPEDSEARVDDLDRRVQVCFARSRGINEPTERVVAGTKQIVALVSNAAPDDLVIALISGGASALLCLPIDGVTLEDKLKITRHLSGAGANIEELNQVRRCLSRVKGGGLARQCTSQRLITCVLSDVLGDPLEIIGSGPTLLEPSPNLPKAISILEQYCSKEFTNIVELLGRRARSGDDHQTKRVCQSTHHVLANNATAVDAAGTRAVELGYQYWMQSARRSEGAAENVGQQLAEQLLATRDQSHIDCLISGGEPTVRLPELSERGRGGRNQQLVLAAAIWILENNALERFGNSVLLSGGTDGEDGPTDAAGAWIDREWFRRVRDQSIDLNKALHRCDAYSVFAATDHLLMTGPTHTNVCDLRVAIVG